MIKSICWILLNVFCQTTSQTFEKKMDIFQIIEKFNRRNLNPPARIKYFCLCIIALLVYFCIFNVCFRIIYSLSSFGSLCAIFSLISYFLVLVAFFIFSLAPILSVKSNNIFIYIYYSNDF
jgi:hypothetical protein